MPGFKAENGKLGHYPVPACALAVLGNRRFSQCPSSRFEQLRRDTAILVMSILLFQLLGLVASGTALSAIHIETRLRQTSLS
jgi:hypothetical protein